MFSNKAPPAWAKGLFITLKDLCTVTRPGFITADEFIKFHNRRKYIHNPGYPDYLEILKLIPKDWQNKIKQNTALPEQDIFKVMFFSPKRKGQEKNIAETQCKDVNGNAINMKICSSKFIRRSSSKSSGSNFSLVSTRIRNRKKLLTFNINSCTLCNPP